MTPTGGSRPTGDHDPAEGEQHLELMLEEIDLVVEPESTALAPAVGIAVAGGPLIPLPHDEETHLQRHQGDSLRSGLTAAGPVAVAGLVVNGASALVVVLVARLVTPQDYGVIAQLLGLFFILSMPGSAVLVGVVRRVTTWQKLGQGYRVHDWVARVHRLALAGIAVEAVVVWFLRDWISRELSLPNADGVVLILVAAGIWILLSVDRGLLQANRDYRGLAANLLIEGGVRTVCVIGFVVAGMGVTGYALGIFLSEVVATGHARWLARNAWPAPDPAEVHDAGTRTPPEPDHPVTGQIVRRDLLLDVSAAFVGLAMLGLLQNVDVIILGRLSPSHTGAYAAISVASKALVFGALALGTYLLPEATIRWNEGGHAVRQLAVTLVFLAVPAVVLLGIAVFIPSWFLTLVFGAKLATAAPAFAPLVGAMIFLCLTVLMTNYLFGVGRRWIVLVLLAGSGLAVLLIAGAHGSPVGTARADLVVQGALALAITVAFVWIHHKEHRARWLRRR